MLIIPDCLWFQMLDCFCSSAASVENVAFLDGIQGAESAVVTTVTIPDAILRSQSYDVTPQAISEAARHLRTHDLIRLAQVHTHPGEWVEHSPKDDTRAYSQLTGSISIVIPHHARREPRIRELGIHVRAENNWRMLDRAENLRFFKIVPSFVNLRRKT